MFVGFRAIFPLAALGLPAVRGSVPSDAQVPPVRLKEEDAEAVATDARLLQRWLATEHTTDRWGAGASGERLTPEAERALAALQGRRAALYQELQALESRTWTGHAATGNAPPSGLASSVTRLRADDLYSCKRYGCSEYVRSHRCQCDELCKQYNNCCADYDATCALHQKERHAPRKHHLPYGHPDPARAYPEYAGFTLWLVEEFDEPIDLDSDPIWTWSDGGLSEGIVRFAKDGIKFEDGKLMFTATDDGQGPTDQCSHAEAGYVAAKRVSSGELRTRYNLFRYGLYEVSMKAPVVQADNQYINGNYISTMFVYRDAKFRHWREIDIEVTGDSSHSVTTNVITAENRSFWGADIAKSEAIRTPFSTRQNFHTYAFEWLPDSITWYIDGQRIRTHTQEDGIPVPDLSAKIIMNLWIFGGEGFGGPQYYNNEYPMHNEYEWFRFYRWDGDANYPCEDMTSSCLTEDDQYLTSNNPCDGIPQVGKEGVCRATCTR